MEINIKDYVHAKYASSKENWEKWIFENMKILPEDSILDMGCGNAHFWKLNQVNIPYDVRLTLIDKYITIDNIALDGLNAIFIQEDICKTKYIDAFDIILAKDILYLLDDFNACIDVIDKALKESGTFYCTCYDIDHMGKVYDILNNVGISLNLCRPHYLFNPKNAVRKLSKHFSSVSPLFLKDELIINNFNDALLFVLAYLKKEDQTYDIRQKLFDYINQIFRREGQLVINRNMCLIKASNM